MIQCFILYKSLDRLPTFNNMETYRVLRYRPVSRQGLLKKIIFQYLSRILTGRLIDTFPLTTIYQIVNEINSLALIVWAMSGKKCHWKANKLVSDI